MPSNDINNRMNKAFKTVQEGLRSIQRMVKHFIEYCSKKREQVRAAQRKEHEQPEKKEVAGKISPTQKPSNEVVPPAKKGPFEPKSLEEKETPKTKPPELKPPGVPPSS